jgi:hypothetical protein
MRLSKAFGLVAVAALASMAFLGASAASAETNTVLCLQHTSLECPQAQQLTNSLVHGVQAEGTVGKLLSSLATVLCLNGLGLGTVLELAEAPERLLIHGVEGVLTGCGTNATHTNCTVEEEELSLGLLLKTGLDEGVVQAMGGVAHLVCVEVGIFKVKIDCKYSGDGLEFSVGGGHGTASETPVKIIEGSFFCPEKSKLDGLAENLPYELPGGGLDNIYILE